MRVSTILCFAALLGGCVHGRPSEFEVAMAGSAFGRHVALGLLDTPDSWPSDVVSGELLYAEPGALAVLTDSAIVRVPLKRVRHYTIFPARPRAGPERSVPSSTEPFRSSTRYPEPLTEAQLGELLETLGVRWVDLGAPSDEAGPDPSPLVSRAGSNGGSPDRALMGFVEEARAATARFASLDAAIAEGYRRLGPSFPGMGEHWIHPGRIVAGRIDPTRPAVVCYIRIRGEARLVSLAYTVPLGPDERPPAEPFGREAWHDHAETVDEESLLLAHPGSHRAADGTRLAMVHLWIWPDNPDGVLAQNNWRLPFAVAGLPLDGVTPSVDAARGLSLHTAGADYYERLFVAAADPPTPEREALRAALIEHEQRAAAWADRVGGNGRVDPENLASIATIWTSLWSRIHAAVDPATWDRLAPLR